MHAVTYPVFIRRVLARLFLRVNGVAIRFDPVDAVRLVVALAAGELDEDQLAAWFRVRPGAGSAPSLKSADFTKPETRLP